MTAREMLEYMENYTEEDGQTDTARFRKIAIRMIDLYEKKNSNYGGSFSDLYQKLGPIAGLVPLHNKLNRLTTLIKGDSENNFESIEDTLIDLANYSIMNLIEIQKQKEKGE